MLDLAIIAVQYSGYISIIKLILFLTLFFLWLLATGWIYSDASDVETKESYWTGIFLGVGVAAAIIWMFIPIFIIGMFLFLIAPGAVLITYVRHRDTLVMDYDRVLTTDHIKEIFGNGENKLEELKRFTFIT